MRRSLAIALLLSACNNAPDLPPYLPDEDGKAPPPPTSTGWGDAGSDAATADAGAVTTLTTANNPKSIFLSGGYVYFTNYATGASDGTVSRVTSAGTSRQDLATSVAAPWAVIDAPPTAYFTTSPQSGTGGVFAVSDSGGGVPTTIQPSVIGAVGLGLDVAGELLWTVDTGSGVAVARALADGGTTAPLDFGGVLSPNAMQVSGVDVFVATSGSQAAILHGLTNGSGNMTPLDVQISEIYGDLALSAGTVYATLDDPSPQGGIVAFPRGGGGASNVVTGLNHPGRLALDGANLYFTDPQGGAVWVADVSSLPATPVQIASGLTAPLPIAVSDAIYVGAADRIVRITK